MCWGSSPPAAQAYQPPVTQEADTSVIEARRRARAATGYAGQGSTVLTSQSGAPTMGADLGRKTLLGQ